MPHHFKRPLFFSLTYFFIFLILAIVLQSVSSVPSQQIVVVGENLTLGNNVPEKLLGNLSVHISDNEKLLKDNIFSANEIISVAHKPGNFNLKLKLFGIIPIKNIKVNVVPPIELYPGGQAVGILLRTKGILVVGHSPIIDKGNKINPAKKVGIEPGDIIIEINGQRIINDEELAKKINNLGKKNKKINITIKRKDKQYNKTTNALYCPQTQTYRIGLLVKDNAGGVGTLTFYDPQTKKYGALGHMVSDFETRQQISIDKGNLVKANIQGIKPGKIGYPGEKIGSFVENSVIGNIEINAYCGIFGSLDNKLAANDIYNKPLPVAFNNQIETGPAEILTVVEGEKIGRYAVEVERVIAGRKDGKNMIIRITDPELLKLTGGIIQGMSGSPIIQNNKIIGAITHVFINDPTRGYGVFIGDMLIEAGILKEEQKLKLGA